MGNNVLDEKLRPQREGPVRCREKLGGLIKEYYREAACAQATQDDIRPQMISRLGA